MKDVTKWRSISCLLLVAGLIWIAGCSDDSNSGNRGTECADSFMMCGVECVDTMSDPQHCGVCGTTCEAEQVCSQGNCSSECASGLTACGQSCVDLDTHVQHCGVCSNVCAASQECQSGQCVTVMTDAGGDVGGDADSDVSNPPGCEDRLILESSGSLDLNEKVVELSGKLTKNGQTLAEHSQRGHLEFVGEGRGALVSEPFSSSGEATYQVEIAAGTYDIYYAPAQGCGDEHPLPCQRVLLQEAVALRSSGSLDLDETVIELSGKLTQNGQTLADDASRGRLEFVGETTGMLATEDFDSSGEATYQVEIAAGTYDIYYAPDDGCDSNSPLPCQRVLLQEAVALQSGGSLDLDEKVVELSGKLTKNGQTLPEHSARGHLEFVGEKTGMLATKEFPSGGEATYQTEIAAGTYDIYYAPAPDCDSDHPLPCQRVRLQEAVALQSGGSFDLDEKVVELSGKLTKNGQTLAEHSQRGHLEFVGEKTGVLATEDFASSGEATYQVEIAAGTYDIYYAPNASCGTDHPLPCQRVRLQETVSLQSGGSLDLDEKVVELSGKLTKNGQTLPDHSARGHLEFVGEGRGTLVTEEFPSSGEATYQVEIAAGTYDIHYAPAQGCADEHPLPCQRASLQEDVGLQSGGSLDVDEKVVELSGRLTKNGQQLPDHNARGRLEFVGQNTGMLATEALESSGAATYQTEIAAGAYDVYYAPDAACGDDHPLPCQRVLLKGCPRAP